MANEFAAQLLMPEVFILHNVKGKAIDDIEDDEVIRELAKRYGVSLQTMIFRLMNLGLIPAVRDLKIRG